MNAMHFLRALKTPATSTSKTKERRRFRPRLEMLDDRLAPATFTVLNTSDSAVFGSGSLRRAIIDSNNNGNGAVDVIEFHIPGASNFVQTISPANQFQTISTRVHIDGTTQTNFVGGTIGIPLIELNGAAAGFFSSGLTLGAGSGGSTISSLVVNRFAIDGILVVSNSNTVQGCYVGTNSAGAAALGNGLAGIEIRGASNTIGGINDLQRNIISGNGRTLPTVAGSGVLLRSPGTNLNVIKGNYIGLDVNGTNAIPNKLDGVLVLAVNNNTIGGAGATDGNVISGNGRSGVYLNRAANNRVQGNHIGVDANANAPVPNLGNGVWIVGGVPGSNSNLIGGVTAVPGTGQGNVISGNSLNGIAIEGSGTALNRVQGNLVGTDLTGFIPIANTLNGVLIFNRAANNIVGNPTGTPGTGAGNVISGNGVHGVAIDGNNVAGTTGNQVMGNLIGTDIAGVGPVANGLDGVFISNKASSNGVGVGAPGAGNIISGNNRSGITASGVGTTLNSIQRNAIGLNRSLNGPIPNSVGVWIVGGATINTIGGPVANTIGGNSTFGVNISGVGTNSNLVSNNFIGTDGTVAFPNFFDGVHIAAGAKSNTIGSLTAAARNVISGNARDGVRIDDIGTDLNLVRGNYIGLQADGNTALGNAGDGVLVGVGAANNVIGGTLANLPGARNFISANLGAGVHFTDQNTNFNTVAGNVIGTNNGTMTLPLGNYIGVLIDKGAQGNTVGNPAGVANAGNIIVSNAQGGVVITGSGSNFNLIRGNTIGLQPAGLSTRSNLIGVEIANGATSNIIGGLTTSPGARNFISGNSYAGVYIHDVFTAGALTVGNAVIGNYVGTGLTGNGAGLGNGIGISLANVFAMTNAINTTNIGGQTVAERNIISSNTAAGVQITDSGMARNVVGIPSGPAIASISVHGNYIGTDVLGTAPLANQDGVVLQGDTHGILVGGTVPLAANVISANSRFGVVINDTNGFLGSSTSENLVQGNKIGTQAGGVLPLGNGSHGVFITGTYAALNTIGGKLEVTPGAANTIAFNLGHGVRIGADLAPFNVDAGTGNAVLGNRIYSNNLIGIDLFSDGVATPNDLGDGDGMANNTQNKPTLATAFTQDGSTMITGTLDSNQFTTYRVEFFLGTGFGNAEMYLGYVDVTINPSNPNGNFVKVLPFGLAPISGKRIIATATNLSTMDTSEFSIDIPLM